jgi:DmsE family decaheme c-type cytochrome
MRSHIGRFGPRGWLACGFVLWLGAVLSVRASVAAVGEADPLPGKKPATAQNPSQAPQPAASFVGQDTCLTCHDDKREGLNATPHTVASDPRTPAAKQGCESCHGPGSRHAEDPVNVAMPNDFEKNTAADANAVCTSCHTRGEHALWEGSQHETRDLKCATCHSVHSFKSEHKQLKFETQRELCANCHRDKIAKLDRSGHMPVREGKMECTTCHNVHGATNVRLLRKGDSIQELCTSCHAEKRGPFLWEHPPSRDGCVTCHDPHGSANDRMLVAKPPLLCQRCHVHTRHPATIYDEVAMQTSARVYGRSCVTCHSTIHGSNHPGGARFTR